MAHKSTLIGYDYWTTYLWPRLRSLANGATVALVPTNDGATDTWVLQFQTTPAGAWTVIDTLGIPGQFKDVRYGDLVIDEAQNLYVVGPDETGVGIRVITYAKGTGNVWGRRDAFQQVVAAPVAMAQTQAVWCDTGGGQDDAGHLLIACNYHVPGVPGRTWVGIADAGALLNEDPDEVVTFESTTTTMTSGNPGWGLGDNLQVCPDGFGAARGLITDRSAGAPSVGAWEVSIYGTLSTDRALAYHVAGSNPLLVSLGNDSGAWAFISAGGVSATENKFGASPVTFTAIGSQVVSGAFTGIGYDASGTNRQFHPIYDPAGGKVWVFTLDSVTKTTVKRVGCTITGNVAVWDAVGSAVSADTGVGVVGNDEVGGMLMPRLPQRPYWWTIDNSAGGFATTTYLDNTAFTMPTVLPTLLSPINRVAADLAAGGTIDWEFNPAAAGDVQTSYALRRKVVGAGAYEYWNDGTQSWGAGEVFNASAVSSVTFVAGKWTTATNYQYSVATKGTDATGGAAPSSGYPADTVIFTVTQPAAPAVTAPADPFTSSATPTVQWTPSGAQSTYEVIVESGAYGAEPGAGTEVYASGEVISASTSLVLPALTNNLRYRVFVRTRSGGTSGLLSPWGTRDFTMTYAGPRAPKLVTFDNPATGLTSIIVTPDNLLIDSESDFTSAFTNWVNNANCAPSRSVTLAFRGAGSMRLSSSAGGDMSARTATGLGGFPIAPGPLFTVAAMVRADATAAARTCRLDLKWYDAAGALISTSTGTPVADAIGAWTLLSCTALAPANAAFVAIVANVLATGGAAELHYFDAFSLNPGTAVDTTLGLPDTAIIATTFLLEWQDQDGVWQASRFGEDVALGSVRYKIVNEYELPPNVLTNLRATFYAALNRSAYGVATVQPLRTEGFLKCPEDPTINRLLSWCDAGLTVMGLDQKVDMPEDAGYFEPVGQPNKIKVADVVRGEELALTIHCKTDADLAGLKALRDRQLVLLLQNDLTSQWFVSVAPDVDREDGFLLARTALTTAQRATGQMHDVRLKLIEAARP